MELNGLKVNFLGDSITEGHGTDGIGYRYTDVFAAKTGAIVRNYGIGGTRIARQHEPSPCPRHDLNFLDRVEEMDPDADVIVVFGGTNDFGHGDAAFGNFEDTDEYTFCGAMRSLILRLSARYPLAQIVIMTPLHRAFEDSPLNDFGRPHCPLVNYVNMEKRIAEAYSIPVLDLWSVSGIQPCLEIHRTTYAPDGLHPNNLGAARIADRLIGFLKQL